MYKSSLVKNFSLNRIQTTMYFSLYTKNMCLPNLALLDDMSQFGMDYFIKQKFKIDVNEDSLLRTSG